MSNETNSFDIADSLLHTFAVQSFGHARRPHASFSTEAGVYGLQRTPEGGYYLRLTSGGATFRSYTHPCRAMSNSRLAYDVTKLQRAHSGETGLSQVTRV